MVDTRFSYQSVMSLTNASCSSLTVTNKVVEVAILNEYLEANYQVVLSLVLPVLQAVTQVSKHWLMQRVIND